MTSQSASAEGPQTSTKTLGHASKPLALAGRPDAITGTVRGYRPLTHVYILRQIEHASYRLESLRMCRSLDTERRTEHSPAH
jgi:hypothetical protein